MRSKAPLKRSAALLLSVMIAATFLFSAWFTAFHMHHDCTGNDCPVCLLIHHFSDMLRKLFIALAIAAAVLFAALTVLRGAMMCHYPKSAKANTPVSLKVQLNN